MSMTFNVPSRAAGVFDKLESGVLDSSQLILMSWQEVKECNMHVVTQSWTHSASRPRRAFERRRPAQLHSASQSTFCKGPSTNCFRSSYVYGRNSLGASVNPLSDHVHIGRHFGSCLSFNFWVGRCQRAVEWNVTLGRIYNIICCLGKISGCLGRMPLDVVRRCSHSCPYFIIVLISSTTEATSFQGDA